jgi:hypothetical protein
VSGVVASHSEAGRRRVGRQLRQRKRTSASGLGSHQPRVFSSLKLAVDWVVASELLGAEGGEMDRPRDLERFPCKRRLSLRGFQTSWS